MKPRVNLVDVRHATCTRCEDPTKDVVAILWQEDSTGQYLCCCAECLQPSLDTAVANQSVAELFTNLPSQHQEDKTNGQAKETH